MPVKSIDAKTLKRWLENSEAVIVDVREPAEHAAQSIPGAALIPLGNISRSGLPDFRNKKLVIHCQAGGAQVHVKGCLPKIRIWKYIIWKVAYLPGHRQGIR